MIITNEIIEKVKDGTDILELISKSVELKKNGVIWKGLCPFHNEKTPSFTVTPDKGIFYCFGCAEGGDSIKWLQKHEGLTFPQAVKELAALINVHIEAEPDHSLKAPKTKNRARKMIEPPPPSQSEIDEIAEKSSEKLLVEGLPKALQEMTSRKGWNVNVIASLAESHYIGLNSFRKLLYIYPEGVKVRNDYDSSRGDRWLLGKAKGNLWRGQELDHELVDNVFVFEGETDLISFMSHRPEGITDAYISVPGSSNAGINPILAYLLGSDRNVFLLFDNDVAGVKASVDFEKTIKSEVLNCNINTLSWKKIVEDYDLNADVNDIGDLPSNVMKNIDKYFIAL